MENEQETLQKKTAVTVIAGKHNKLIILAQRDPLDGPTKQTLYFKPDEWADVVKTVEGLIR